MHKSKMIPNDNKYFLYLLLVLLIVCGLFLIWGFGILYNFGFLNGISHPTEHLSRWGSFGDAFGPLTSLFTGGGFLIAAITIWTQSKEIQKKADLKIEEEKRIRRVENQRQLMSTIEILKTLPTLNEEFKRKYPEPHLRKLIGNLEKRREKLILESENEKDERKKGKLIREADGLMEKKESIRIADALIGGNLTDDLLANQLAVFCELYITMKCFAENTVNQIQDSTFFDELF